jgi:hypothetical protein
MYKKWRARALRPHLNQRNDEDALPRKESPTLSPLGQKPQKENGRGALQQRRRLGTSKLAGRPRGRLQVKEDLLVCIHSKVQVYTPKVPQNHRSRMVLAHRTDHHLLDQCFILHRESSMMTMMSLASLKH